MGTSNIIPTELAGFERAKTDAINSFLSRASPYVDPEKLAKDLVGDIGLDHQRLRVTVNIIYSQARRDKNCVGPAVKLSTMLCIHVSPTLSDLTVTDEEKKIASRFLVSRYLSNRILPDLEADIQRCVWNWQLMCLFKSLSLRRAPLPPRVGSKTQRDFMSRMSKSGYLFWGDDLKTFIDVMTDVGRNLDLARRDETVTDVLERLRQRARNESSQTLNDVSRLLRLRERGWSPEKIDE